MNQNNGENLKKINELVCNYNEYEKARGLIKQLWNKYFDKKYKIDSDIKELMKIFPKIEKDKQFKPTKDMVNIIITTSILLSNIEFKTSSPRDNYEKAYTWLSAIRKIVKKYIKTGQGDYWEKYIKLITYTGRKIHIMEIPMKSQTPKVKTAYCNYLHITNQGGIKEIRRILNSIPDENTYIKKYKNKILCDIYADSPSQRNNKKIAELSKDVLKYSQELGINEKHKSNIKYYWYLKSAVHSLKKNKEFFSLPDIDTYKNMKSDITNAVSEYLYKDKKTIHAALLCVSMINFAVKNEQYADTNIFILWFCIISEMYSHKESLNHYYIIYKNLIEIMLTITKKGIEPLYDAKFQSKYSNVPNVFFNNHSKDKWENIDFVIKKKLLPTSPLGKITIRIIESYFNMVYDEVGYFFDNLKHDFDRKL